jgi:hypothetical protein
MGGNHLIFANYKKACGTRGHEAKTLIIIIIAKRRNPPLANAIAPLAWSQLHGILQNRSRNHLIFVKKGYLNTRL